MLRKLFFIIFSLICISSCTTGMAENSAWKPTVGNIPATISTTPHPVTATVTPRPTIRPTLTVTNTATITLTPTITNTPGPLAETGPWIIIQKNTNETGIKSQYWVMNLDGSGLQPLRLPAIPDDRQWNIVATTNQPYLAIRTRTLLDDNPIDFRQDGIDDQVWVIRMPDMHIIRKIPLLNEDAWEYIRKVKLNYAGKSGFEYNIPTQLGLLINPESFLFSPHGRYLTYSASTGSSGTDLYLYDTVKDEIRQLTTGKTGAQVWFWSPDGETVVYRNADITSAPYYYPELNQINGVYSYNLFSGELKLYDPNESDSWESIVHIDEQSFFVSDFGFESLPSHLRSVNFKTGKIQQIYENNFNDAAYDEKNHTLLLLYDQNAPFAGIDTDIIPGIYRYDFTTGKLVFIREGDSHIWYDKNISLFQTNQKSTDSHWNTILFDYSGNLILKFQNQRHVDISPDGQWILAVDDEHDYKLYASDGVLLKDIGKGDNIHWLYDSSGFFMAHDGISLYRKIKNWEPIKIYNSDCCPSYFLVPSDISK